MKKIISVFLSLVLCLSLFSFSASAINSNGSITALRAQFQSGEGPSSSSIQLDYSYYTPVKTENDAKKYPLVVLFPGSSGGPQKGDELLENDFARWSAVDIQAKFTNGGAFIMLIRSRQDIGLYWDATSLIQPAKETIDDFIAKNPNVDSSRIYVGGWSLGGNGAKNFTVAYPNFVAAAAIFSERSIITESDAARLADTGIWIFQCKNDTCANENLGLTSWENVKKKTNDLTSVRYSTADSAPDAGSWKNHGMWFPAVYDMSNTDWFLKGFSTVDGAGNTFPSTQSLIEFFLTFSTETAANCSHSCHKVGISSVFWKILVLIYKLFGVESKRVCECGMAHW